jgi:glycosyltransferase involved in cell wall biosynthesis
MPTVTTIIPTYNRAQLLREALDSVLTQSRPVDEIIVIDDGSTDNTMEVLRGYGDMIRCIQQPNGGPGAARNRGLREATGDYIAFLDSDDIWVHDKAKIQMEFFNKHPHLEFVFGDMANFTMSEDNEVAEIKNPEIHNYFVANATNLEQILECLIMESVIPTPTVMFKHKCTTEIGFFDETMKICEDLDYWLRAARTCRFGFINTVLAKRRRHDGNLIRDWVGMNIAHVEVLTRVGEKVPDLAGRTKRLLDKKISKIHYDLGSYYLKEKKFADAYHYLRKGLPRNLVNFKWLIKLVLTYVMLNRKFAK